MSNRICLVATKFVSGKNSEYVSHGYRIYDDYGAFYNNIFNEDLTQLSDLEFLEKILGEDACYSDSVSEMFDFIRDTATGMEINDNWYDYSEIKDILS